MSCYENVPYTTLSLSLSLYFSPFLFLSAPNDSRLLSNRSHVYLKSGDAFAALENANRAIKTRPNWAKGYFRKTAALTALERNEDAFVACYQCLVLEESDGIKPVLDQINRILFQIILNDGKMQQEEDDDDEEENSIGNI